MFLSHRDDPNLLSVAVAQVAPVWGDRERTLAVVVEQLPPWRVVDGGFRVVTKERLARELIGAVGLRADLFALLEKAEGGPIEACRDSDRPS